MSFAIVTPSYGPDFQGFARLHESVLRHTGGVLHHAIVPEHDVELFESIGSDRLRVHAQMGVLPRSFVSMSRLSDLTRLPRRYKVAAVNLRRPWPPVRGWILQQLLKLAFISRLEEDVALIVDSDVMIVRDLDDSMFRDGDRVRLYRSPGAVHSGMVRHLRWRENAARLLGADAPAPDAADYISSFVTWSPATVRAMLARIESVAGRPWSTVLAAELEFSECILYGEYVAAFGTEAERSFVSSDPRCLSHWDPSPLDLESAAEFLARLGDDDLAVLIQSTSGTAPEVLEFVSKAAQARTD